MESNHPNSKRILAELIKVIAEEELTFDEASLITIDLKTEIAKQKQRKIMDLLGNSGPEEIPNNYHI